MCLQKAYIICSCKQYFCKRKVKKIIKSRNINREKQLNVTSKALISRPNTNKT